MPGMLLSAAFCRSRRGRQTGASIFRSSRLCLFSVPFFALSIVFRLDFGLCLCFVVVIIVGFGAPFFGIGFGSRSTLAGRCSGLHACTPSTRFARQMLEVVRLIDYLMGAANGYSEHLAFDTVTLGLERAVVVIVTHFGLFGFYRRLAKVRRRRRKRRCWFREGFEKVNETKKMKVLLKSLDQLCSMSIFIIMRRIDEGCEALYETECMGAGDANEVNSKTKKKKEAGRGELRRRAKQ